MRTSPKLALATGCLTAIATATVVLAAGIGRKESSKLPHATAWARLSRCLVGEPLAPGARASPRLTDARFGAIEAGESGEASWPRRCEKYARALRDAIAKPSDNLAQELVAWEHELARGKIFSGSSSFHNDMLFNDARDHIDGTPGDVSDVPAAPRASVHRELPWLGESLSGTEIDHRAGAPRLLFSAEEERGCWFATANDGGVEARCVSFPDAMPRGGSVNPLPSERPDDVLVGIRKQGSNVYETWSLASGRRLAVDVGFGWGNALAWVAREGAWGIRRDETNELLLVREGAQAASPIRPAGKDDLWPVGDTLLSYDGDKDLLSAQAVDAQGALGAPVEVGTLAKPRVQLRCVAGDSAFVLFEGRLAVRMGGRWSLVEAPSTGDTMTCDEGGATLVGLGREGHDNPQLDVRRTRCTSEACKTETANLELATSTGEAEVAAAAVGDRVLLAWNAHGDAGVRVQLAPLLELPKAPVRVVYDNTAVGFGKLVHGVRTLGVGAAGVVLIHTSEAVVGVVVDAEGRVAPLRVVEVP